VTDKDGNKPARFNLRRVFSALRHRNYRLFFAGQTISNIGTWMQMVAVSWMVYRITGSVFMLGLVAFISQFPSLLISPLAGVLADRYPRRALLLAIQSLSMLGAFVLFGLALTHRIKVWEICAVTMFMGVLNACDFPVRQSFTAELIEDTGGNDLGNAIALNSLMFNGAKLIGPSIAGILIALVGEKICFALDGISFWAVIASLLMMKVEERPRARHRKHVLHELAEGFRFAYEIEPVKQILLLFAVIALTGFPVMALMPVFAKDILHGGPNTLGFLMTSSGCGALVGGLYMAGRTTVSGLEVRLIVSVFLLGLALVAFTWSRSLWLSLALLLLAGFGMMVQMLSTNTLLQTMVGEVMRGRVMSFYAMALMGVGPVGNLLAGSIASRIGVCRTVFIGGLSCVLAAFLFARKLPELSAKIHPFIAEKEIAPESAT
jgi:MFS family permease